jgi:hypothetical protein
MQRRPHRLILRRGNHRGNERCDGRMGRGEEDAEGDVARGQGEGCVESVEGCVVEGEEGVVEGGDLSVWEGKDFFGGAGAEG